MYVDLIFNYCLDIETYVSTNVHYDLLS